MILFSPIISGSLTFADGATVTYPEGGIYSGSFSGSIQVHEVTSHIIPSENITYDLGSSTHRFRDLYLSNNSIFFEYSSISVNTGSGDFELKDYNNEPAKLKLETFSLSPSGSSTQTFISQRPQGGVQFLSISDTQMVTYRIDNYDLQSSVTFSYIDSDGNLQTVSVPANTNYYELDAREGSVNRTGGTDKYRIKLLRVPNETPAAPIEVQKLTITGSAGGGTIVSTDSGVKVTDPEDETQPKELQTSGLTLTNDSGIAGTKVTANAGTGQVSFTDLFDEPAGLIVEQVTIPPTSGSSSTTTVVIKQKEPSEGGGVSFSEVSSTQCARYKITNHSLQANLFFNYTDCDGNSITGAQILTNSTDTVTMQFGSFERTLGSSDNYTIKLLDYVNTNPSPIEVGRLELPIPDGPTFVIDPLPIDMENPGGGLFFQVSGSNTPAPIKTGNVVVSGSNGTSTITNDLPGEGLAVTDSTGSLTPIKVKTIEIEDPDSGDIVSLSVISGSLNTTATDSSGSALPTPKSNLSGSFTGSFELTGDIITNVDCVKIGTAENPICEIHSTDIFGSISATNGIISGSSQITELTTYKETVSGNSTYSIAHNLNEEYPIVQAYNTTTKRQEFPSIIESLSANAVEVSFSSNFSGKIIVKK
jgi:hypothetical protein